jgi:hypothetical protein
MTTSERLNIYVTGDAGKDVFIDEADASQPPPNIWSGAAFVNHLLSGVNNGASYSCTSLTELVPFDPKETKPVEIAPLPSSRIYVKQFGAKNRISKFTACDMPEQHEINRLKFPDQLARRKLLVVHDGGGAWSDRAKYGKFDLTHYETFRDARNQLISSFIGPNQILDIIVNVKKLPEVYPDHSPNRPRFRSDFWNELVDFEGKVGIVLSLSTLRRAGAAISHGLSWEQTVEDLTAELYLFPQLRALTQFDHLFVRADLIGLIHIQNKKIETHSRASCQLRGTVYFIPYARDGLHRDPAREGSVVGKNTAIIASLAHQVGSLADHDTVMREGIKSAIRAIIKMDDEGYDRALLGRSSSSRDALISHWDANAADVIYASAQMGKPAVGSHPIPDYLLAEPLPGELRSTKRWRILNDTLEFSPIHRINVATAIVMSGHKNVLNRRWEKSLIGDSNKNIWKILTRAEFLNPQDLAPDYVTLEDGNRPAMPDRSGKEMPRVIGNLDKGFELNAPVAEFGGLTVAEREEIEGLCSIRNLLKLHINGNKKDKKPISLAVFGPPGSGKSFAVKQLSKTLDPDGKLIKELEFNIAQFRTPEDLGEALDKVKLSFEYDRIPLVFFDEFDCSLEKESLGWLKYFLAPMQDGTFYGARQTIEEIGPAIFVFAGGTHTSFERFDPRRDPPNEELGYQVSDEYKTSVRQFTERKGPDFVSRLRGYINILPVNADPGGVKHFIRRALVLRSFLEKLGFTVPAEDIDGRAMIDAGKAMVAEPLIYALLTTDRYRHGARSMEAIVRTCTPIDGWIHIASLPSRAQLNMHVDAEEFFIRVYRGSSRLTAQVDLMALEMELRKIVSRLSSLSSDIAGGIKNEATNLLEKLDYHDPSLVEAQMVTLRNILDYWNSQEIFVSTDGCGRLND